MASPIAMSWHSIAIKFASDCKQAENTCRAMKVTDLPLADKMVGVWFAWDTGRTAISQDNMAQPTDTSPLHPQELLDRNAAAWIALGLVVLLTLAVWRFFDAQLEERVRDRFLHRAESTKQALVLRLQAYEQALQGASALFAASDMVARADWSAYVGGLQLDHNLPGIQGTGFALMVRPEQRQAHEASVRAEGFPSYRIHPEGTREIYSTILYMEPFGGRNLRAFGYDMYSDPVRREAMDRARDTGKLALSGRVILVQEADSDVQPGFLMYLPIYRGPAADALARRASLLGFVFSPFRAHDMISGLFAEIPRDVEIELFDHTPDLENLLFSTITGTHVPHFMTELNIEFGGRTWIARFSSNPYFESDAQSVEPILILIAGIAVGLMLFAVIHGNARHRRHISIATARLARSRDDFRMLVENMPGVVFRTAAGPPWTVIHVSRGVREIFDKSPDYFIKEGHTVGEFVHPDDRDRVHDIVQAAIANRTPYEVEFRVHNRLRGTRWVIARGQPNVDYSGRAKWVDGLIFDITERRAAEAAIRNLAFIDPLTQLPNRRFLMDRLRQGMANSDRKEHFGSLLFIDLDNFKDVNDSLGHDAGDALLIEVANRLKNSVREGDTVVRLGGDEFVVMLEDLGTTEHDAHAKTAYIADKVLVALNRPHAIGDHAVTATPSIGYTTFCGQDVSAEELLRRADRAMYTAKAGGRNQVCSHDTP